MKRLWLFAIVALTAGFFTSCETDPVIDPVDDNFAPSLTLLDENPVAGGSVVFTADATIALPEGTGGSTTIFVGLEGSDSTPPLRTLETYLNDEKVDDALVSITAADGTDLGSNTTALLVDPYDQGFSVEVGVRTAEEYGVNTFRFVLTDDGGLTSETSITITTEEEIVVDPGTPLSETLVGVLLNQAGPTGTGGLDLDAGAGVGSMDASAEIRDNGIDTDLPVASNWRQTISTVNGTTIRTVNTTVEGYDFATVTTKEEVLAAWDAGSDVTNNTTDVVNVGDEFIVSKADGSTYYLLQVTDVNVTETGNDDSYTFNIKY